MKSKSYFPCVIAGAVGALVASVLPALLTTSQAESARLLPLQGRLTDAAGTAIPNGDKVVEFKIYDAPTGGIVKWAGEVHKLSVNDGLVNTMLGSKSSLGNTDFSTPTYLQITIDSNNDGQINAADPPLLPRQSVVSAVYAAVTGQMQYVVPASGGNPVKVASAGWDAIFDNGNPVTGAIKASKFNLLATTNPNSGVLTQNGTSLIHTYGDGNFFAGAGAGNFNISGGLNNTGVGSLTLQNLTSGDNNTGVGLNALRFTSSGMQNTAIGVQALNSNTVGNDNTASGFQSLYNNVGSENTAVGTNALFENVSGNNNIAIGVNSGKNLTTGSNNIHIAAEGKAGEAGTIRIGTDGIQGATYVAGINQHTVTDGLTVAVDAQGRLGKAPPRGTAFNGAGTKKGDVVISASSGSANGGSNAAVVPIDNQKIALVTSGGPVLITLTGSGTSFIGVDGAPGQQVVFSIWRDGIHGCNFVLTSVGNTLRVPPGSISFFDMPPAGTATYELKAQYVGAGHWLANGIHLLGFEL